MGTTFRETAQALRPGNLLRTLRVDFVPSVVGPYRLEVDHMTLDLSCLESFASASLQSFEMRMVKPTSIDAAEAVRSEAWYKECKVAFWTAADVEAERLVKLLVEGENRFGVSKLTTCQEAQLFKTTKVGSESSRLGTEASSIK